MGKGLTLADEAIISKIYLIRGQKVMIDYDLAELYGVETRALKQSVRRNIERFPSDFMFELTKDELESWKRGLQPEEDRQEFRYLPFCFTEQGVTMLSCILNSGRAIEVNIRLIRIFTKLREMILTHKDILLKLDQLESKIINHDSDIKIIFDYLKELLNPKTEPMRRIGFKHAKDE